MTEENDRPTQPPGATGPSELGEIGTEVTEIAEEASFEVAELYEVIPELMEVEPDAHDDAVRPSTRPPPPPPAPLPPNAAIGPDSRARELALGGDASRERLLDDDDEAPPSSRRAIALDAQLASILDEEKARAPITPPPESGDFDDFSGLHPAPKSAAPASDMEMDLPTGPAPGQYTPDLHVPLPRAPEPIELEPSVTRASIAAAADIAVVIGHPKIPEPTFGDVLDASLDL